MKTQINLLLIFKHRIKTKKNQIPSLTFPICLDSVLNYDEDSVDIYSGLEDSPRKDKKNSKPTDLSFLFFC